MSTPPSILDQILGAEEGEILIHCDLGALLFRHRDTYDNFRALALWMTREQQSPDIYLDVRRSGDLRQWNLRLGPNNDNEVKWRKEMAGRKTLEYRVRTLMSRADNPFNRSIASTLRVVRPRVGYCDIDSPWLAESASDVLDNRQRFEQALEFLFDHPHTLPAIQVRITFEGFGPTMFQRDLLLPDDIVPMFNVITNSAGAVQNGPPAMIIVELLEDIKDYSPGLAAATTAFGATPTNTEKKIESPKDDGKDPAKDDDEAERDDEGAWTDTDGGDISEVEDRDRIRVGRQAGRVQQAGPGDQSPLRLVWTKRDGTHWQGKIPAIQGPSRHKRQIQPWMMVGGHERCPICDIKFVPATEGNIRHHISEHRERLKALEEDAERTEKATAEAAESYGSNEGRDDLLNRTRQPTIDPQLSNRPIQALAPPPQAYDPNHPEIDPRLTAQAAQTIVSPTGASTAQMSGQPRPFCSTVIPTTPPEMAEIYYAFHQADLQEAREQTERAEIEVNRLRAQNDRMKLEHSERIRQYNLEVRRIEARVINLNEAMNRSRERNRLQRSVARRDQLIQEARQGIRRQRQQLEQAANRRRGLEEEVERLRQQHEERQEQPGQAANPRQGLDEDCEERLRKQREVLDKDCAEQLRKELGEQKQQLEQAENRRPGLTEDCSKVLRKQCEDMNGDCRKRLEEQREDLNKNFERRLRKQREEQQQELEQAESRRHGFNEEAERQRTTIVEQQRQRQQERGQLHERLQRLSQRQQYLEEQLRQRIQQQPQPQPHSELQLQQQPQQLQRYQTSPELRRQMTESFGEKAYWTVGGGQKREWLVQEQHDELQKYWQQDDEQKRLEEQQLQQQRQIEIPQPQQQAQSPEQAQQAQEGPREPQEQRPQQPQRRQQPRAQPKKKAEKKKPEDDGEKRDHCPICLSDLSSKKEQVRGPLSFPFLPLGFFLAPFRPPDFINC